MRRRNFLHLSLAAGVGLPSLSHACAWDRDTLDQESKAAPGFVPIITGRFARNPDLYYTKRIARATEEVKAQPDNLALYDDLGVAHDRIGDGDSAIEWMAKKRAALDGNHEHPEHTTHEYRYHANLGTFQIHQWIRENASRLDEGLPRAAHQNILAAIQINPQAHFGREIYQLMAIDALIERHLDGYKDESPLFFSAKRAEKVEALVGFEIDRPESAATGIAGLVYLGSAWQSYDVFRNLGSALGYHSHSSIAQLAYLRAEEILEAGGKSLLENDPTGSFSIMIEDGQLLSDNREFFVAARTEADAWHAARTTFMIEKLTLGQHPDTHPEFWDGAAERYTDRPPEFRGETVK